MNKKKKIPQITHDVNFIFEIGTLRYIDRSWKHFLNPDYQNLTEHHFRVLWLSLLIARMEGVKNDEKIMKMAISHDIAESRTGDVDYLQRQYVKRNEHMALTDIFSQKLLGDDFLKILKEYEERKTIEAKIVKDADNLDVDFELKEQESSGHKLPKDWDKMRKYVAINKLYTKSAKKLWKALQTSNPHEWHVNGRNRFNDGDWKK